MYKQANVDKACCTSDDPNGHHRKCNCREISNQDDCRDLCSKDSGCKGYHISESYGKCQIATTSSCPSDCSGPHFEENVGKLDPNAECGEGNFNGGCMIKLGIANIANMFLLK